MGRAGTRAEPQAVSLPQPQGSGHLPSHLSHPRPAEGPRMGAHLPPPPSGIPGGHLPPSSWARGLQEPHGPAHPGGALGGALCAPPSAREREMHPMCSAWLSVATPCHHVSVQLCRLSSPQRPQDMGGRRARHGGGGERTRGRAGRRCRGRARRGGGAGHGVWGGVPLEPSGLGSGPRGLRGASGWGLGSALTTPSGCHSC